MRKMIGMILAALAFAVPAQAHTREAVTRLSSQPAQHDPKMPSLPHGRYFYCEPVPSVPEVACCVWDQSWGHGFGAWACAISPAERRVTADVARITWLSSRPAQRRPKPPPYHPPIIRCQVSNGGAYRVCCVWNPDEQPYLPGVGTLPFIGAWDCAAEPVVPLT